MESLGFIEVKGFVPTFEAADAMVKSANVDIVKKVSVGAGLMTVVIKGDIGGVKTAIDSGVQAVKRVGEVAGCYVIARPTEELKNFLGI